MRLSILDQVPLTAHTPTRSAALTGGLRLAQDAEELGFHRIWYAEHHGSCAFASIAPEVIPGSAGCTTAAGTMSARSAGAGQRTTGCRVRRCG